MSKGKVIISNSWATKYSGWYVLVLSRVTFSSADSGHRFQQRFQPSLLQENINEFQS